MANRRTSGPERAGRNFGEGRGDLELRQNERLLADIAEAHRQWEQAVQHFNCAVDSECIDDAIYLLAAAEMRYESLLRVARRKRIGVNPAGRPTVSAPDSRPRMPGGPLPAGEPRAAEQPVQGQ